MSSRTYTSVEQDCDGAPGLATFGQYIAAVRESQATPVGELATVTHLAHSDDSEQGFRSNIGFVNTSAATLEVEAELLDQRGAVLGVVPAEVPPWSHHQCNNVFGGLAGEDLDSAYARLRTLTPEGSFVAYASVVDNRSGDPVYVPAE